MDSLPHLTVLPWSDSGISTGSKVRGKLGSPIQVSDKRRRWKPRRETRTQYWPQGPNGLVLNQFVLPGLVPYVIDAQKDAPNAAMLTNMVETASAGIRRCPKRQGFGPLPPMAGRLRKAHPRIREPSMTRFANVPKLEAGLPIKRTVTRR
jgi:hypothetical protein